MGSQPRIHDQLPWPGQRRDRCGLQSGGELTSPHGLELTTEPDCWRSFPGTGSVETLRPDLFAVTASGDYEDCWFIEVDRGTESLPTLIRKCQQYQRYRTTGREQAAAGTFPLVVWLLPTDARLERLTEAIERTRQLDPALFRLVTDDRLIAVITKGPG